ncbi:MAG: DUF4139 domain-containing protein [Methanosarcina sp.]
MEFKKLLVLSILAFLGFAVIFSVSMSGNSAIDNAQAYKSENEKNGIESSSDVNTNVRSANPLESLTELAGKMSGHTEVTIYNQNLALVKEKKEFDLKSGVNSVEYSEVTSQIDPTSVLVEDPTDKKTSVLEQQYEYDLVSSSNLLDKYMEKEITVTDREGKTHTGKLLSHDEKGVVLERNDGSVVALDASKVEFSDASGLLTKPTLVWQISSPTSGKRDLLISYLTGGLSWSANYIVKTSADSTKADIRSWVSIDNRAGTTFDDAKLKLVAGDVHRVSGSMPVYESAGARAVPTAKDAFSEATIFEYHLYTLEKPVTLKNNQAKQISLLSADSVPVRKELIFDSWKGDKVQVVLKMENSEAKGLGKPLPKGIVRVYQPDSEGQLQFIGEDQIDHTPKGEKITVTVGNAFDVVGKRTQTGFEQVNNNVQRTSSEIELNNSKPEAQNVTVVEHFYGDWEIINSSDKYEKTDASTVEFRVSVPANGTKKISYTVENRIATPTPIGISTPSAAEISTASSSGIASKSS